MVFKSGTPQQRNGHDCGVFMTRTADYIARDGILTGILQDDMPYWRRRMIVEVLRAALID